MSVLFGLIHVSDAIVRLEVGTVSGETLDATINPLYAVVYLGGIAASWNRKRIGYIMVLVLSALSTWGFLGHTTGLTSPNLVEIGRASGVVFVFVVLVGEVASISAVILSTYALRKGPIKLTSNGASRFCACEFTATLPRHLLNDGIAFFPKSRSVFESSGISDGSSPNIVGSNPSRPTIDVNTPKGVHLGSKDYAEHVHDPRRVRRVPQVSRV